MTRIKKFPIALLVLFICSLNSPEKVNGSANFHTKPSTATTVISIKTDPKSESESLREARTYVELKTGSQDSLPSSFTICVSVLVTTYNRWPLLFTLVGKDGGQWFAAHIARWVEIQGQIFDKSYLYTNANQFAQVDTISVFPNEWIRSCIAFDTVFGLVQWVARGELVGNDTFAFAGISNATNVPIDLTGKLSLGKPSK